jgi:hypothetical protein
MVDKMNALIVNQNQSTAKTDRGQALVDFLRLHVADGHRPFLAFVSAVRIVIQ